MASMTLLPMAVPASGLRRAAASYVRVPMTHGVLPSMATSAHHGCDWSLTTDAHAIRQANTKARKAFGARRLGETST